MLGKNEKIQKISAKKARLSFDMSIISLESRILTINVNGLLRDIKYSDNYFEWFIEDLIFFIEQNGIQKRWDFETILIKNIASFELSSNDEIAFKGKFKTITNWDVKGE